MTIQVKLDNLIYYVENVVGMYIADKKFTVVTSFYMDEVTFNSLEVTKIESLRTYPAC